MTNTPTPARPALDEDSIYTKRTITHDEAVEIAHRLINSHFNKEPCARASIPARPDYDDDLLILAFIEQQRRSLADMRGQMEKAEKVVDRLVHHSCIADAGPTDKDEYDNAAERDARAFLALARSAP